MFPIIDSHCHVYPEKIVEKAVSGIGDFYHIPMCYDGRIQTLLENGKKYGISHHIIFSVATKPSQTESINKFIAATVNLYPDKFTGLGPLHPDSENIDKEVEQILELGLKGVKLHPDFQKFALDDERCDKIYKACNGKLPILIHAGDKRYDFSNPNRLAPVLEKYPDLIIIGAHLSGYSVWDDVERTLIKYPNLYVDCSSTLYFISTEKAKRLIDLFGANRVLFATDFPMWNIGEELNRFNALGLTDEEKELIFYKNACKIFKISEEKILK